MKRLYPTLRYVRYNAKHLVVAADKEVWSLIADFVE
jgi:hypothetical protein